MSILFGIVNQRGSTISESELRALAGTASGYGFTGLVTEIDGKIGVGLHPFLTNKRTKANVKLVKSPAGNIAVLDGFLYNFRDLCVELGLNSSMDHSDASIALAAYETWGEACCERFYGDWSVVFWNKGRQELYLSRDHAGTHSLFYEQAPNSIRFSSMLDALCRDKTASTLDRSYLSCYLANESTYDLTPYEQVKVVPPGCTLRFANRSVTRSCHWTARCQEVFRYKSDGDYERHFVSVLTASIECRVPSDENVLAHLSGGRDSSTIVCISDHIRRSHGAEADDLVDTVSYFDDTEPHWDELPFIRAVEEFRGKRGVHIDASTISFDPWTVDRRYSVPCLGVTPYNEEHFEKTISGRSYSSIISGVGGDDLLGGIPNPTPELMDLLWDFDLNKLLSRSLQWSLTNRTTIGATVWDLIAEFSNLLLKHGSVKRTYAPWINRHFIPSNSLLSTNPLVQIPIARPSNIFDQLRWPSLVGHLPHSVPTLFALREYRYPYLDRALVEFVLRLPREQLVRPGEPRSLMRRSLRGIVPDIILDRKRKAFISRRPHTWLRGKEEEVSHLLKETYLETIGCIDGSSLRRHLTEILTFRKTEWSLSLARLINLELWIRARFNLRPAACPSSSISKSDVHRTSQSSARA